MAEFENEQNVQDQEAVADDQVACGPEPDTEAEGKILDVKNTSSRSFHLIKKRYGLPQREIEGVGSVYYLQSKTRPFDSILRRAPCEVNKETDSFRVPLGTSCLESVVSLYGLSNGAIYGYEKWQKLLHDYNEAPNQETLRPLLAFLRAAAVTKCIDVNGGRKSKPNDEIGYCQEIAEIDDKVIVSFFLDMIR